MTHSFASGLASSQTEMRDLFFTGMKNFVGEMLIVMGCIGGGGVYVLVNAGRDGLRE